MFVDVFYEKKLDRWGELRLRHLPFLVRLLGTGDEEVAKLAKKRIKEMCEARPKAAFELIFKIYEKERTIMEIRLNKSVKIIEHDKKFRKKVTALNEIYDKASYEYAKLRNKKIAALARGLDKDEKIVQQATNLIKQQYQRRIAPKIDDLKKRVENNISLCTSLHQT